MKCLRITMWILLLYLSTMSQAMPKNTFIEYMLSMPEPHTHYFVIDLTLNNPRSSKFVDLSMPVWTPGSYLVRDFAHHVEDFQVADRSMKWHKIDKNTWRIYHQGSKSVQVRYRVYAYELTVRLTLEKQQHKQPYFGIVISNNLVVQQVLKGTPAYQGGILKRKNFS